MTSMDVGRVRRVAIGLLVASLFTADVASAAKAPALKVAKPAGSLAADGSLTVRVTVSNPGRRKAKAQAISAVLSKDARADAKDVKLAGRLRIKALAAGKKATA